MTTYFSLFPVFTYSNAVATDITRRVTVLPGVVADARAYAPYEIPAGQRADQIADGYYGTPDRDWMVWMSTGVIDPYFDWYLSETDLLAHVVAKYGSIVEATSRIHHWAVAWYDNGSDILSPPVWASLDPSLKKYYEPTFGDGGQIISYSRRDDDVTATTNMVVTTTVANSSFSVGERINTYFANGALEGSAEVSWANSATVILVNLQSSANVGVVMVGQTSGQSQPILTQSFTANVIPVQERPYWAPVTVLDWERDRNERRKNVRLIDAKYLNELEIEMKKLIQTTS